MSKTLTKAEVSAHCTSDNCWIVLHEKVYNITQFIQFHPGGRAVLLEFAGKDATAVFDSVHPKEIINEYLQPQDIIGNIHDESKRVSVDENPGRLHRQHIEEPAHSDVSKVDSMLSLDEIESKAAMMATDKALAYYASATDDELTKAANTTAYRSILLRPRIFIDCTKCELETSFLGYKIGLPIYVAPAAMARLAHPDGEAGIAAACSKFGAMQIISKNASMSVKDIVRERVPGQIFGWQLYVLKDIKKSEEILAQIRGIPEIKFIVLTLDAPFPGKREADERLKMQQIADGAPPQLWGTESALTWQKTLTWLAKHTSLPIVLKGLQTHEDAYAAALYPCVRGIIISNHGGRALDTAPSSVHTLLEIQKFCPEVFQRVEVLVDGGIKRGTDVVKALALGAKAVGLGRAPLWGLTIGGQKGVERTLQILADETKTAMRLLGVQKAEDLGLRHINTSAVNSQLFSGSSGLDIVERALNPKL